MNSVCPVCGYNNLTEPPYDPMGRGSFEICPCCGFEFGCDDFPDKTSAFTRWRNNWILAGCPWFSTSRKPAENWDPQLQLRQVRQEDDSSILTESQKDDDISQNSDVNK